MFACPSPSLLEWKKSAAVGRIFVKFDILGFFEKLLRKFKFSLKSGKNNGRFMWTPNYMYDSISLSSVWNEECFRQSYRGDKNTRFVFSNNFPKIAPFLR